MQNDNIEELLQQLIDLHLERKELRLSLEANDQQAQIVLQDIVKLQVKRGSSIRTSYTPDEHLEEEVARAPDIPIDHIDEEANNRFKLGDRVEIVNTVRLKIRNKDHLKDKRGKIVNFTDKRIVILTDSGNTVYRAPKNVRLIT